MPKPTSRGGSPIVEKVGVTVCVGQVRRVKPPPHPYGSPAMDLKKEQAEEERRRQAEAAQESTASQVASKTNRRP